MPKNPYKPPHLVKTKMIPVRVSQEYWNWLTTASERLGVPISRLMREGARVYARQLERKGGPGKESK